MQILAINGSHRKGKNTAQMLQVALDAAAGLGAAVEFIELTDYSIKPCLSCNKCLKNPECAIQDDDLAAVAAKMLAADGIILGSPVYFANVSGAMKDLMDRSRWLYFLDRKLAGKVGGALTHAGLRNGGQELTQAIIERYLMMQGLLLACGRDPGQPPKNIATAGAMYAGCAEKAWFRNVAEDELAVATCQSLGREMVRLIKLTRARA